MRYGDKLDDIIETAVARGDAPGVVAAVGRGDEGYVAAAGVMPDGPLTDTIGAERAVTTRDLLTFTWGFGMQGAMFMAAEPWPIVTAVAERELGSFGPANPDTTPEPDTFMARLGDLPLLAQPGERWLYSAGSQVLGVL